MTYFGICTLPDGRNIEVFEEGYHEGDTNAFIQTNLRGVWEATQDELTDEELNSDLGTHFLHEYISENTDWKLIV